MENPPLRCHIGTLDRLTPAAACAAARRFVEMANEFPDARLSLAFGGLEADWFAVPPSPALEAYITAWGAYVFEMGGQPALARLDMAAFALIALAMSAVQPVRDADGEVRLTDMPGWRPELS